MNKVRMSCLMMLTAAVLVAAMLFPDSQLREAMQVETVAVQIGDVAEYAVIPGRLTYQDEQIIAAAAAGRVEQICVSVGDRVAEGEALVRMDAAAYEQAASALLASGETLPQNDVTAAAVYQALAATVLRAPSDGTVRQVNVRENTAVAAGTPAVVLSSSRQEIICTANAADAERIRAGMWAQVSVDDEAYGLAWVKNVGPVQADAETGRLFCTAELEPEEHIELPAGAAVDVSVYIAGRMSVPVLPVQVITPKETVWWVHDGRCTEIPVEIILSDEMNAWVNLPEGVRVAFGEMKEGQHVAEVEP